ncbi:MAG: M13-type metalloendopeptidase [Ignavibacteriaceae bacterium]
MPAISQSDRGYLPQVVNAFYQSTSNSFTLLAAILNAPMFSVDGSDAQNYGGIGFIIGHEIGHGFDDQGSQFDASGNMVNWWNEEDTKKFSELKAALIDQADHYEIMPGKYLKGALEIGEIIGDLSGAEISFRAYSKIIKDKNLDYKEGCREFFIQLAKTWRDKLRANVKLILLDADVHPPSEYRANGIVKNFDTFHQVIETKPGDKMYLPPVGRLKIRSLIKSFLIIQE